jgi:hypothetical protein
MELRFSAASFAVCHTDFPFGEAPLNHPTMAELTSIEIVTPEKDFDSDHEVDTTDEATTDE